MSAEGIINKLRIGGRKLIFAESVTGGLMADAFISVPGASDVVLGSEVTYDSRLKVTLLGIDEELIQEPGPVSSEVASAMAKAVSAIGQASCDLAPGQVIALSTTGNAGPESQGTAPVGRAYLAICDGSKVKVRELNLSGTRQEIRAQVVLAGIEFLWEHLSK